MRAGEEPSTAAAQRLSRSTSLFLFRPSACLECDEAEADEALECAVCMSLFIEPIIFPGCSHSFCRLCLLRLQMHAAFRCPLCRCHSSLTVSELTRWPVARELRSRAKAAAPALYEKRSHDHKQRIACLLREHAVKRLQDKCPYREHAPVRFSRTNVPWRFTPVTNCLDAVCRCLGRRWCAGLRSYAAKRGVKTFAYGAIGEPGPSSQILENDVLRKIGAKYGVSPAQVAVRWNLQNGNAVSARPTAEFGLGVSACRKDGSCASGLRDRAFAVAGFALTKQEMRDIDALTAPDAVPCLFSKACNPDLGTGNAADPLRKT